MYGFSGGHLRCGKYTRIISLAVLKGIFKHNSRSVLMLQLKTKETKNFMHELSVTTVTCTKCRNRLYCNSVNIFDNYFQRFSMFCHQVCKRKILHLKDTLKECIFYFKAICLIDLLKFTWNLRNKILFLKHLHCFKIWSWYAVQRVIK